MVSAELKSNPTLCPSGVTTRRSRVDNGLQVDSLREKKKDLATWNSAVGFQAHFDVQYIIKIVMTWNDGMY